MADGRGGYQRPSQPAPVSGPGKLSRRTDGQPTVDIPNPAYGEQTDFRAAQQGAPMESSGASPTGAAAPVSSPVVPLGAATARPGEPVTAGAATGPGPGPEALGLGGQVDPMGQYMADTLPMLEIAASMPFANTEFRQFVRRLRAMQ